MQITIKESYWMSMSTVSITAFIDTYNSDTIEDTLPSAPSRRSTLVAISGKLDSDSRNKKIIELSEQQCNTLTNLALRLRINVAKESLEPQIVCDGGESEISIVCRDISISAKFNFLIVDPFVERSISGASALWHEMQRMSYKP